MKKIKVFVIFGTRPEAIKMAPLIKELNMRINITTIVCVTAQHRQMLDQVLTAFNIVPQYDLNIMMKGQTLADITTRVLIELEKLIEKENPNLVLVHGDTTTAFAGALAAFYKQIPVGHVEAGLRTYNKYSPYPEEMNRQMIDNLTTFYFAPTEMSKENLIKENKNIKDIYVTGNTAIDCLKTTIKKEHENSILKEIGNDKILLLTAHRRENIGEPMYNFFRAIKRILNEYEDVQAIYPIHLNPKVREIAKEVFKGSNKMKLIEPLDVVDFHNLMNKAYIILTDSGGIQEEAPSLGKPVLVLRDTTERPEGINAGTLKLVGIKEQEIYENIKKLLADKLEYDKMSKASNPYGDGLASKRIADAISERFELEL